MAVALLWGKERTLRVAPVLAIAVIGYSLFTIWVARASDPPPLVEQLEAPRLMPFQRLLMIALAAMAILWLIQWLTSRLQVWWQEWIIAVVVLSLAVGSISTMEAGNQSTPENERALYPVETTGDERFADFEDAIALANDVRPEGAAVFVVGNVHEWWHEQLWAPGIVDGTYYYDDWLWYWHSDQSGPYDPNSGYYMNNPTDAFTDEYFSQHGIGVIVVSDMYVASGLPPRTAARTNPMLQSVGSFGAWDVYTVNLTTSIVTRGDAVPDSLEYTNQRIEATFDDSSGDIVVRQNWFPRWQAEVNGEQVEIERSSDGYMLIPAPDGPVELTLVYGVTGLDWIARAGSVAGVVGLIIFTWKGRPLVTKREKMQ